MLKPIVAAIAALLAATFGLFHPAPAPTPTAVQSPTAQTAAASLTLQQYPAAPKAGSVSGVPGNTNNTTQQFQDLSSAPNQDQPAQQTIIASRPSKPAPTGGSSYITPAAFNDELYTLQAWVRGYVALATSTVATTQVPQQVAGGGNGYPFAAAQAISNLSNITVSHVSGLAASDIPALAYLPSSGGTVSGNLTVTGAFNGGALTLNNASTTLFSASGPAYFGSTATSTFGADGSLTLASLGTFANGFVSQASSTVVGNFTATGNGVFGGNVGIGTSSPATTLSVSGIATAVTINSTSLTAPYEYNGQVIASFPLDTTGTQYATFYGVNSGRNNNVTSIAAARRSG